MRLSFAWTPLSSYTWNCHLWLTCGVQFTQNTGSAVTGTSNAVISCRFISVQWSFRAFSCYACKLRRVMRVNSAILNEHAWSNIKIKMLYNRLGIKLWHYRRKKFSPINAQWDHMSDITYNHESLLWTLVSHEHIYPPWAGFSQKHEKKFLCYTWSKNQGLFRAIAWK